MHFGSSPRSATLRLKKSTSLATLSTKMESRQIPLRSMQLKNILHRKARQKSAHSWDLLDITAITSRDVPRSQNQSIELLRRECPFYGRTRPNKHSKNSRKDSQLPRYLRDLT